MAADQGRQSQFPMGPGRTMSSTSYLASFQKIITMTPWSFSMTSRSWWNCTMSSLLNIAQLSARPPAMTQWLSQTTALSAQLLRRPLLQLLVPLWVAMTTRLLSALQALLIAQDAAAASSSPSATKSSPDSGSTSASGPDADVGAASPLDASAMAPDDAFRDTASGSAFRPDTEAGATSPLDASAMAPNDAFEDLDPSSWDESPSEPTSSAASPASQPTLDGASSSGPGPADELGSAALSDPTSPGDDGGMHDPGQPSDPPQDPFQLRQNGASRVSPYVQKQLEDPAYAPGGGPYVIKQHLMVRDNYFYASMSGVRGLTMVNCGC